MAGSTESLKKIMSMETFKVQSDKTLKVAGTNETKGCSFISGKQHCTTDCSYYNETEKRAGMVLCRCLEKVMGFVTRE